MWQDMGKNMHQQESGLSLGNHGPSCMWGILHHFHHNRWYHAKKRLAHSSGKRSTDDEESTKTASNASDLQESVHYKVENPAIQTKPSVPTSTHKNSMKSRLKSLITDEMSKRKSRHRRSTSYPTRAPPDETIPTHHRESSDTGPTTNYNNLNDDSVHSHHSPKLGEDNGSRTSGSCELCATMLKLNYLKQDEVNKLVRQPVRDHTLLRDKLVYAIEQSQCDSLQESKLFMDALDLLNLRKEVFLKILQDPSSSLAHQLHRRRAPNSRLGLSKSVSFPVSGSSAVTDLELGCANKTVGEDNKQLSTVLTEDDNNKHALSRELELSDKKRRDNNKIVVLKRFKNLREKIKHVILDRKKEKNRIIMDAVHHKIPYGHKARDSKEGKFGKQRLHKRTSSFDESYGRYNQLLDNISSEKEAKDHTMSDGLRFRAAGNTPSHAPTRPVVFKRILSLPDLRAYSSIHIDDNCNVVSLHNVSIGCSGVTQQKPSDTGSPETKLVEAHGVLGGASHDNLFDVGSTFDESIDSKTWETASSHDFNPPQQSDSDRVSENESYYQEDEIGMMSASEDVASKHIADTIDALETQAIKKLYSDLLQLHVDTKNEAEFNYVKDVLELSGFTQDELLGKWHSAEHPLDPSVFDEVEGGCLVSQPETEGGGPYDHLLLFDLINEVLLDIHERSFYYWPVPLTVRSRIHRMPKGYRVLEEVWAEISWLLSWTPEIDQSIDDAVSRDLEKHGRWMSLQMDAEFVGLEVEDLIFDDLLDEIV
ncbi:hypothetical protein CASFOL_033476 [Castilleja foliolosa]|uniref:DUF4378 domain-containing protein n=1 Tax=Castilleja foliolosa TaxID=1961234 RepID=A0ABD3C022_9LAMI